MIAFTRLYLGVHFLADVLGGILLGGLMLLLAYRLIIGTENQQRFFTAATLSAQAALPLLLYLSFMFILPLLLAVFSLGPTAKATVVILLKVLGMSPVSAYIAPIFGWILATFRRGDRFATVCDPVDSAKQRAAHSHDVRHEGQHPAREHR